MKSFNKLTKLRDKQSFIVCWLYHNQQTIFDNVPEFDYDRVVTREEASRMIGNFVKNILAKEYIRPADDKRCQFVDIADANPGLFDLIYASCRYGIFNGTYHHEFLPKQELNQAHAIATVLRSSYEYQDEQSAIWYAPYVTTLQEKNLLWR
jgi:hypothetical protein